MHIVAAVVFMGAFVVSVVLTATVRACSIRKGFVAHPVKDRYHTRIVALGGGIAIFWTIFLFLAAGICIVQFLIAPGLLDRWTTALSEHAPGFLSKMSDLLIVMAVALLLHLVGLWDDRKHLGPMFKLVMQFAAAITVASFADIRVEFFIENKLITVVLSAFWIVLIMNAFNFLDNMDGLSAGIAFIACTVLFVAQVGSGQLFVGALTLVFLGTLLGFLVFNLPPARIFMGDAGSLVVGFFVALITLRTTYYHESAGGHWHAVFMPLLVMAVPLYDFVSVTLLRISQGKSPFVGDTQHFSHRMRRRGLTDLQTALTLYLATLCTGLGAIFLYQVNLLGAVLIFIQTLMVLAIIAILEATGQHSSDQP